MSISNIASWVYFSIHLLWPVHLIFCYINAFNKVYTYSHISVSLYNLFVDFPIVGYIINGSLVTLIFLSILFPKMRKDAGILFFLDYIGSETYPYLRYLIEITLYLSAFFATSCQLMALLIFGLAAVASLIHTLLLQNFTLRKG